MNLEKICEALSETDRLGSSLDTGCAVAQLFYVLGKSPTDVKKEYEWLVKCTEYFDGLLVTEYDLSIEEMSTMANLNDSPHLKESPKARHTRVLAHYEGMLIECLILQSSCQAVEDCKAYADVLIAQ